MTNTNDNQNKKSNNNKYIIIFALFIFIIAGILFRILTPNNEPFTPPPNPISIANQLPGPNSPYINSIRSVTIYLDYSIDPQDLVITVEPEIPFNYTLSEDGIVLSISPKTVWTQPEYTFSIKSNQNNSLDTATFQFSSETISLPMGDHSNQTDL
jgi:uncharacterized membrane protein